jgi:beta-lactam-binding protein with PASTA domain
MLYNITDVQNMAADLAGTYALANAIDASATATWNETAPGSGVYYGFAPIGTGTGVGRFTGSLDGQGYAITNITINRPTSDYEGLFGSTNGATITRIGGISGAVTGKNSVGVVVGRTYSSTIQNCITSATISAAAFGGGIVGHNSTSSTVTQCASIGNVAGSVSECGGVCGINSGSVTSNCYSAGNVVAPNTCGGVVGSNISAATESNCYSTGDVTAAQYAGGISGLNTDGVVGYCFATGTALAALYKSGMVGRDLNSVGVTGSWLPVAELKKHIWTRTAGWNFSTIWQMAVVMPNLVGQTLDDAAELLSAQGMTIGTSTEAYSATVAKGLIISQSVAAGTGTAGLPTLQAHGVAVSPKTGDVVDVVVSLGSQVEVQNTLGLTQAAAEALLTADGFTVTVTTGTSDTVAVGIIDSQTPAGGTLATLGSAVTINRVTGRTTVDVPGVLGLDVADAISAIEDAGLVAVETSDFNEDVPAGIVFEQSPAIGVTVSPGSNVEYSVSDGPEFAVVPNLIGRTQAAAISAITAAGLTSSVVSGYHDFYADGIVYDQDVVPGTSVDFGDEIEIKVSQGLHTETVPDVMGDTQAVAVAKIEALGFTASVREAYSDAAAGLVINQSPIPGEALLVGHMVYVVVSLGVQSEELATGFAQSPWKACAPDGSAFIGAVFVDGKAGYTAKTTGSARVRRIEIRYQSHDRRSIRGTRPMPNSDGSGE